MRPPFGYPRYVGGAALNRPLAKPIGASRSRDALSRFNERRKIGQSIGSGRIVDIVARTPGLAQARYSESVLSALAKIQISCDDPVGTLTKIDNQPAIILKLRNDGKSP